ncbi:MAG TPA: neutral zinc metallopeptidase [Planctomycetota bacterium]|jgi:predicted metalloprotease|nr:neutral zinc metallopeptidase [Planctomycetota bacterium]
MEWQGRRESDNVDDRRGFGGRGMAIGGGVSVIGVIIALLLGVDPRVIFQGGGGGSAPVSYQEPQDPKVRDEQKRFVSVVLADTEDVWHELFRRMGKSYREPRLVLFSGRVQSACGLASDAVGPFYCPGDSQVYIDLQFFEEMKNRFRAPGDFAQAYVIAHEIGHHVQNQLGISQRVHSQQGRLSQAEYNRLSVRLELQADFLAGVWAHHAQKTKHILQPGDLDEALRAANAIGDDRLQRQSRGYVVPDAFTHGTSSQRARWFRLGFETGNVNKMEELFTRPYNEL